MSLSMLTAIVHMLGIILGIGAASAKLVLLLKVRSDSAYVQAYLDVVKPITQLIVAGLILMTLSGIGWLLQGYPFTTLMIVKLVMVGIIWVLGPIIDNVLEPKFKRLAPVGGKPASAEFRSAYNQYLGVEILADVLFYAIVIMWMLR